MSYRKKSNKRTKSTKNTGNQLPNPELVKPIGKGFRKLPTGVIHNVEDALPPLPDLLRTKI
jgi:hypothetical protein